ncbi:hypothetical protein [Staphylococcus equorum]|uniref:Phage protein n=1 Tax=Staphylococcus equorum TaxID=246432 RepID=A0AAP7IDH7_9STAP|nr:hypothetical protein [Staphylococcus equorum]MDK9861623.1 hypothetical protein [Staphylococcus equorum]OEK56128.1 hypothetical protein ASS94_07240 [Staphylococcus equorum]
MVKIKRKVQKNLPQLIEWAWENPKLSRNKRFVSENKGFPYVSQYVIFNEVGYAEIENSYCYGRNDLFTIEVEEEITEDTVIEKLYHTTIPSRIVESGCSTIKSTLEHSTVEPIAFYILNDDLTMTLIWRDGRLVE